MQLEQGVWWSVAYTGRMSDMGCIQGKKEHPTRIQEIEATGVQRLNQGYIQGRRNIS